MSDPYKDLVLSFSPALYWALDDEDGATDLSGNGRDGTPQGVTVGGESDSPFGSGTSTELAASAGNRITSTYSPFVTGASRTFCGWAKRLDSGTTFPGDSIFTGDGTAGVDLFLGSGSSVAEVTLGGAPTGVIGQWGGAWPSASAPPESAPWVFWAVVLTDTTVALYIDGALVSEDPVLGIPWADNPGTFTLGYELGGLHSLQAHVAIFEHALSAAQIAQLADPASSPPPLPQRAFKVKAGEEFVEAPVWVYSGSEWVPVGGGG